MEKDYKLLKSLKTENNYTYKELSEIIGCSKPFIWQIINNKRKLSYEMAIIISSIFYMTPDDIFYSEYINEPDFKTKLNNLLKKRDEQKNK